MKRKGLTALLFHQVPEGTHYRAGSWSWVPDQKAAEYIDTGVAAEWVPEDKPTPEPILPKPTMDNTKKEIQDYLDAKGIEYEDATKAELLELI